MFPTAGNQFFSSDQSRVDLSVDDIDERIALIDELLLVNSNPTAVGLLQKSRNELLNRIQRMEFESSLN